MERAIPKNKGEEFFSLLHQLGIDLTSSPQSTRVKGILAEIDPEAKERLAQFNTRRAEAAAAAKEARDQRIAVAREARAQEAREAKAQAERDAQAKAAKEAQKAARLAKQAAAQNPPPPPAAKPEEKKLPAKPPAVEVKKPAKPAPPAPAKPAAKPGDDKSKKVSSTKGLTKRKPK
jgi:hypothetical protein